MIWVQPEWKVIANSQLVTSLCCIWPRGPQFWHFAWQMGGKISRLPLNRRRHGRRRRIIRLPSLGARLKRRLEKVIEAVFLQHFFSAWKCGHYCLLRLLPETAARTADRIPCAIRKFNLSLLRHLQIFEVGKKESGRLKMNSVLQNFDAKFLNRTGKEATSDKVVCICVF